jgi:2-dehydro-3-deoxyphosphogluconate aldolase/(4S)-4-hydroxy-2-oxoglutarate aldolase
MTGIGDLLALAPVIPVLVIDEEAHAVPIAEALVEGGLPLLEVTLRTPVALAVIRRMAGVPGAIVGAGTVRDPAGFDAAVEAGARFIVSPGLTDRLATHAAGRGTPFLPGIATASDLMRGLDFGLDHFKFFPAVPAGGLPALSALAAPFADVRFCPTGGISLATAPEWLAHPCVRCVGGSWIVAKGRPDRAAILDAARAAAALRPQPNA